MGSGMLADLALPETYLRRVADRVLRNTYSERYRCVLSPDGKDVGAERKQAASAAAPPGLAVEILRPLTPATVLTSRARELSEGWPGLRGFRAGLWLEGAASTLDWPLRLPDGDGADALRAAADIVQKHLASDGILLTCARVLELGRSQRFPSLSALLEQDRIGTLRRVGIPTDWLACFAPPGSEAGGDGRGIGAWIDTRLAAQGKADELGAELAALPFRFQPSCPGFALASESGENEAGLVRLQLTRGDEWKGRGDGGSIDLARELVERTTAASAAANSAANSAATPTATPTASPTASPTANPAPRFLLQIEERELDRLRASISTWTPAAQKAVRIAVSPTALAQWAQDNAKCGSAPRDGHEELVVLAPRYASRGEEGALFVPGETFAVEGLVAAGVRVVQSPLLFQGGDLLCVRHPRSGQRLLIAGEGELFRNTALGLTREQVLAAFRAEFGVDRCLVLPAASFHVDLELCVRAVGDELVACTNDTHAAIESIIECGLGALERGQRLDANAAAAARGAWRKQDLHDLLGVIDPALKQDAPPAGGFSTALAALFSTGPADDGVGNLQCFLAALDLLSGISSGGSAPDLDPHTQAYLASFRRREFDRGLIVRGLESVGLRVVPIPSFAEDEHGIDPLNGVQVRGAYWMPTYGGLYAPLDHAAEVALGRAFGSGTKILPIPCAETQRRAGGLHCSISVGPRPGA